MKFVDRVASEAVEVKPLRVFLAVLAAVFYALGWVVGLIVVAFMFALGAVLVGFSDVRARFGKPEGRA